jgi:uncharacterized protein (TIGR02266 family)
MQQLPQGDAHEGRLYPRARIEVEVTLESDDQFFSGLTQNISETGVFVATHSLREVGAILDLELVIPFFDGPIRVSAEVRWVRLYSESSDQPPGMGLAFLDLEERDAEAIEAFIARRPSLLWE